MTTLTRKSATLMHYFLSLTFAIGRVVMANALCFQRAEAQGLHYIFIGGKDSLGSAAMRGGGWFGSVSLS